MVSFLESWIKLEYFQCLGGVIFSAQLSFICLLILVTHYLRFRSEIQLYFSFFFYRRENTDNLTETFHSQIHLMIARGLITFTSMIFDWSIVSASNFFCQQKTLWFVTKDLLTDHNYLFASPGFNNKVQKNFY